jgi:hypothetical protein
LAQRIPEAALRAIENAVELQSGGGADLPQIAAAINTPIPKRTLQYRLRYLLDAGRLMKQGDDRWARYRMPTASTAAAPAVLAAPPESDEAVPLSTISKEIRRYLSHSVATRKPVGYNQRFLDSYRPNVTFYHSGAQRAHLAVVGKSNFSDQAAGTYAKRILNRLLIDLSWNSSRLENNTYSLLDTKRLIGLGEEAPGRDQNAGVSAFFQRVIPFAPRSCLLRIFKKSATQWRLRARLSPPENAQ